MKADAGPRAIGSGPLTESERRAYELGRRRYLSGDLDGALEEFDRFLRTRRGFADVHYMVGTLLERKRELPAAIRSLEEALALNPGYVEALLALASFREQQGDFDRSRELTERAHALLGPTRGGLDSTTRAKLANLQAELGDAFREAGVLRDAVDAYRKALDRCPQFHDVRHRLAIALRELGRPDAALTEFRRVLQGNPRFLAASVQLAVTLYSLGRSEEACAQLRGVLAEDPARDDARMYLRILGAPPPLA
jgi:tetratricopeptide (TPR) repeat protein